MVTSSHLRQVIFSGCTVAEVEELREWSAVDFEVGLVEFFEVREEKVVESVAPGIGLILDELLDDEEEGIFRFEVESGIPRERLDVGHLELVDHTLHLPQVLVGGSAELLDDF